MAIQKKWLGYQMYSSSICICTVGKWVPIWCIQFHKSPVWLPILVVKGPYFIKMWVPTSLRFGSQFPSSLVSFPHSAFDPAVLTDFRRGRCRIETDVSNNKPTTFEEEEKAGARTFHPQLRSDSDNALSLSGDFWKLVFNLHVSSSPGCCNVDGRLVFVKGVGVLSILISLV